MTEEEVVQTLREHFESLFPKVCPSCRRVFVTLLEYIQSTKRIGPAMSYDAELHDWKPGEPIGSVVPANCLCGTTLALTTQGMALPLRLELLNWVRLETAKRGVSVSELLEYLRDEIRRRILSGENPGDT